MKSGRSRNFLQILVVFAIIIGGIYCYWLFTLAPANPEDVVERCFRNATRALQDLEIADSENLQTIRKDGRFSQLVLVRQPTGRRLDDYSAALANAMKDLPPAARESTRHRQIDLLKKYTDFRSPIKVVERGRGPDPKPGDPNRIHIGTAEHYVARRDKMGLFTGGGWWCESAGGSFGMRTSDASRYDRLFQAHSK